MPRDNKKFPKKEFQKIDGVYIPKEQVVNKESPVRSIAKTISWRIIASFTTFIIFYFSSGNKISLAVLSAAVGVEAISKVIIYFLHERLWANIHWGKRWSRYKLIRRIKLEYIRFKRRKK